MFSLISNFLVILFSVTLPRMRILVSVVMSMRTGYIIFRILLGWSTRTEVILGNLGDFIQFDQTLGY